MGISLNRLFVPSGFVKGGGSEVSKHHVFLQDVLAAVTLGEDRLEMEGLESEPDSPMLSS